MLVDLVHGDQSDLVVTASDGLVLVAAFSGQDGNAGIGDSAAQGLALQSSNSGLNAFVAHDIGVLSHGSQDEAVLDQAQDSVGLVEADNDNVSSSCLDSVACTVGGAFVTAEDTNDALGDVVLSDGLGLCSVAFTVLGLQQGVSRALESLTEASLTLDSGIGSSVDVDDTDGTLGDALSSQLSDHGLACGLTCSLVVGGEGSLGLDVGGRVNVDDLDASGDSFLQCGRDGVGAVCSHDDGLAAGRDSVVDLLDLLCIILSVGGHVDDLDAQLSASLHGTLFQGDPVLVNTVHGDQCDLVAFVGGVVAAASCEHSHDHCEAKQNGKSLFHCFSS